jgi:hypothetical protein
MVDMPAQLKMLLTKPEPAGMMGSVLNFPKKPKLTSIPVQLPRADLEIKP